MNILVFSDVRTTLELPKEEADLIVLLGQIPSMKVAEIERLYDGVPIIGLLSNSDSPNLYEGTSIVNVHKTVVEVNGIRFAGFGGAPKRNNESSGYYSEDEVESFIEQLAVSNVDVLLSYTNLAYGDIQGANAASGFKAYNRIVLEGFTKFIIHGRLHADFHRLLGNTEIYSISPYKLIEIN